MLAFMNVFFLHMEYFNAIVCQRSASMLLVMKT